MTVTWTVQTEVFPMVFEDDRTSFLMHCFWQKEHYVYLVFNAIYEDAYLDGDLKEKIEYQSNEFKVGYCLTEYENSSFIFISMPEPREYDFGWDIFTEYYIIPFTSKGNSIEVLDLYAVEKIKNEKNRLIAHYKDGKHQYADIGIPYTLDDVESTLKFMGEYIFNRENSEALKLAPGVKINFF